MVFNSLPFLFFFSAVFFLYWFVFAKSLNAAERAIAG
jgi:hypothetical protein